MPPRRRPLFPPPPPRSSDDLDSDDFDYPPIDERPFGGDRYRGGEPPRRWAGRGRREDAAIFRALGLVLLATGLLLVLALPASPLRVVGRAGSERAGQGVSFQPRADLPALPPGLSALSRFYDLSFPEGLAGAQVVEVALSGPAGDGRNLGFYTHDGRAWKRIAPATVSADGRRASGELPSLPNSVAVLRSVAAVRSLGLVVGAGREPDQRLLPGASVVVVRAASLDKDGKSVSAPSDSLGPALRAAAGRPVYIAVGPGEGASPVRAQLGADLAASTVRAAKSQGAGGVLVDLGALDRDQRDAMTAFARTLGTLLREERLGFLVAVPAVGRDGGAYDWPALLAVADGIWLVPRVDPEAYYREVEAAIAGGREAGVDTARIALVLDRRSLETWAGQRVPLSRRDALALASTIGRQGAGANPAGGASGTVSLSAPFLAGPGGGLRWHDGGKAVMFSFVEGDATHRAWVENRFSAAYRLDLAGRLDLGGIVVEPAEAGEDLDVAALALDFAQGIPVLPERPFGPYLAPCWQAVGGTIEGGSECWKKEQAAPSAAWRAPKEAGAYGVRLVVSDGVVFVGQELTLRVGPDGQVEPAPLDATPVATAPARAPTVVPEAPTARPGTPSPATPSPTAAPSATASATPTGATATATSAPAPPPSPSAPAQPGAPPASATPGGG